jgi:hypothetical protein
MAMQREVAGQTIAEGLVQLRCEILPKADHSGFDIAVRDAAGVRHTMLGFETEEEAWTWIRPGGHRD